MHNTPPGFGIVSAEKPRYYVILEQLGRIP